MASRQNWFRSDKAMTWLPGDQALGVRTSLIQACRKAPPATASMDGPPSNGAAHQDESPGRGRVESRFPTKSTYLLSGNHTALRADRNSGWICLASPPCAGTTNTCDAPAASGSPLPSAPTQYAIHLPSGEKRGRRPLFEISFSRPPAAGTE